MEEKIKLLEKELKYLTREAINKEIEKNKNRLEDNIEVKTLAKEIYLERGLDVSKLNHNLINNLIDGLSSAFTGFKGKDKIIKRKMILDIVYLLLLIILIKIPFDLVRDIGYEYIEMLSTNNVLFNLWNLGFLILYTITMFCTLVVLLKNFNAKYNKS